MLEFEMEVHSQIPRFEAFIYAYNIGTQVTKYLNNNDLTCGNDWLPNRSFDTQFIVL